MRRTAIEAAGEWGRSGGGAAPAFGGGEGVVGKGMQWSGQWSVEEGEEEGGLLPLGRRLVAGDNDLFFAWLPAYE